MAAMFLEQSSTDEKLDLERHGSPLPFPETEEVAREQGRGESLTERNFLYF